MFKTETHMHTKEGSSCGMLTAEEIVREYHKAGFHTLCISNHFGAQFFRPWGEMNWEETIERFMLGYRLAKAEGERLGMNILFSAEIEFDEPLGQHYLVYGIDEEFLKAYPKLHQMPLADFYALAKEKGILVIQAHPYRDNDENPNVTPELVDGFEVRNPNPRHVPNDEHAEATAAEYSLYRTAGSDAHRTGDVARTAMCSEEEIKTVEDYIALVKSGKAVLL